MSSSKSLQAGSSFSLRSSSSSSIRPWTHDVFLSFRGDDVRQNFISHLYNALHKRGINTYIDNNLKKGEKISLELLKAIDGSTISIVVLSKNYSDSEWCLDELLKILECKEMVKQIVLPLFYDVDPSDIRHQKGSFGEAFTRVEYKFKDDKVKIAQWKAALGKVADLSGFKLGERNESDFILDIITRVDSIMVNRTFLDVAKYPVGIETRVRDIYQHLSMERNDIVCMVGIFGTGGIGKTTISKDIYNKISYKFEGSCFLKNIRETSKQENGLIRLQNILLYEILGENLDIRDFDRGINVISHRLHSKRVLLILDDVDELKQLETLARDHKWFGSGSRIIITTRDQHLLNISKVDSKYELKILVENEARKLFSLHAFEKDEPLVGYAEVFQQLVQYAQGLPLALTVLGSDLKNQTICQWESALDKYKQIPNKNIQNVLQVSYDGLEEHEKDMFLDIACFFKGEPLADVIKIFESCNFHPSYGIPKLIDKCLITIAGFNIWMHDLLQDMGREIVRKESPKEPGVRSRLWFHEDIRYILEENTGTSNVEGIKVDLPDGHDHDTISLSPNSFKEMKRLRIFICHNAHFSGEFNCLPNTLRVLNWSNYHLHDLPTNFRGEKLAVFKMHAGCVKEIISRKFKNLTIMKLSECMFLTKISDLSSCSNLKELDILDCKNLVQVHDSVGFLDKLVRLRLYHCSNLKSFPRRLKLISLEVLTLRNCSKLENFPEIDCIMEFLCWISLWGTAIKELPSSIGYLTPALKELFVGACTKLPSSIHRLQNLKVHCLSECINGCFTGMERLFIEGCKDPMRLPICISHPQHLKSISLNYDIKDLAKEEVLLHFGQYLTGRKPLHITISRKTKTRSELESSAELPGQHLSSFYRYFDDFSFYCTSTLQELDLSGASMVRIPLGIESFVELRILKLRECYNLQEILHLPPKLQDLYASECLWLERFPKISTKFQSYRCSALRELRWIDLSSCHKLDANIGSQAPNLVCVEEHIQNQSCGIIFPGNKIPDWFSHTKETSNSDSCELGICGPLYLDEIIGIVFCAVLGSDPDEPPSGICVSINSNKLIENKFYLSGDLDHVYLNYSFPECVEQWLRYPTEDNLRFSFYNEDKLAIFKSCGVHIIYKHEENENLRVGEFSVDSSNGIQLCKRHRDDGNNNLEFSGYPQQKRRPLLKASSFVSSFHVEDIREQDSEMPAEFPDILDSSFDY